MFKFIINLFNSKNSCDIIEDGCTRIYEGKEKTNNKIVRSKRPNVQIAVQPIK